MVLLHDTTLMGGAQCWFHEAATWERVTHDAEVTTLVQCAMRWTVGRAPWLYVVFNGQSNAINYR